MTYRIVRNTLLWSCCMAMMATQLSTSAQTLVHRYSFSDSDGSVGAAVADSVGGTNWDGILPNGGTFTGNQLILAASSQQYVKLPVGILSNYTAVTIDTWATFGTLPVNCFFFGFGDTDTNNGTGINYIFCAPQGGRIAITEADPGYTGEQGCGGAGDLSSQTVHLTAVFNPPAGYIALYTNGVLVSQNDAVTVPMSSISNMLNYIGRSLYNADPYPDIEMDEFRIYDGGLSPLQVAANDVGGPDTYPAPSYGTITSIQLSYPSTTIAIGSGSSAPTVSATASGLPNPVNIMVPDSDISYTSDNTNAATVNPTNGIVTGVGSGTANIIAGYAGVFATQAVQVVSLPTTLIHRYSFNENTTTDGAVVHDSVGTANGVFNNASGLSSIANGQLFLVGTNKGDYVSLPSYLISPTNIPNNALTFEIWATVGPSQGAWTRLWEFGAFQSGGVIGSSAGQDYWSLMPNTANNGGVGRMELSHGGNVDVNTGNFLGQTNVDIVGVFNPNPSQQVLSLYVNGQLVGSQPTGGRNLSAINDVYSWLGRSLWSGDAALDGSIDEFRIYDGPLNSFQINAAYLNGPSSTNLDPGTFQNFEVSAGTPTTMTMDEYRRMSADAHFTIATNVNVLSDPSLKLTSSDTNVLTVTSPVGMIHAVGTGTASVTGVYTYTDGAITTYYTNTTALLTVVAPTSTPSTLIHRYSFTTDASDSVGTANGTLTNGATVSGGQLQLNNGTFPPGGTNYPNGFLDLPPSILPSSGGATIEIWFTFAGSGFYTESWTFCNGSDVNPPTGAGGEYLMHTISCPQPSPAPGGANTGGNRVGQSLNGYLVGPEIFAYGTTPNMAVGGGGYLDGSDNCMAVVTVADDGTLSYYLWDITQGIGGLQMRAAGYPLSDYNFTHAYLGRSAFSTDNGTSGTIDEFRIYSGVRSQAEVEQDYAAGPDTLPVALPVISATASAGNLTLTWPTNDASGFTLQSSPLVGSGASWSTVGGVTTSGGNYQATVPITGSAQYFRLMK